MTDFKMYADMDSDTIKKLMAVFGDNYSKPTVDLLCRIPGVTCIGLNENYDNLEHVCIVSGHNGETHLRNLFIRLNTKGIHTQFVMSDCFETNCCIFSIVHTTLMHSVILKQLVIELEEYLREV